MKTEITRIRPAGHPRHAFTLIELLTVIAIIGILAAIIIPTVGKVREAAKGVKCVSNLRTIGVAINLFAEDHRGRLPGGLYGRQGAPNIDVPGLVQWRARNLDDPAITNNGSLHEWLAPWAGFPVTNELTRSDLWACPLLASKYTSGTATYFMCMYIDRETGSDTDTGRSDGVTGDIYRPFGYPPAKDNSRALPDVYNVGIPPSRLWAVVDCTQKIPPNNAAPGGDISAFSPTPAHGNANTALFFDWGVGKLDAQG
ncbi:MAG: prepilin-type N-terminal cleavage/methylation domain-containing protein [Opitutaceae bacterium]|jgi:prepilin-type N-terminal cleavage/methylation domain-containing protein|nr:prepilin-type N-terminal cleavage/methylation domain-containing protein [Opitutaceae bacterium]